MNSHNSHILLLWSLLMNVIMFFACWWLIKCCHLQKALKAKKTKQAENGNNKAEVCFFCCLKLLHFMSHLIVCSCKHESWMLSFTARRGRPYDNGGIRSTTTGNRGGSRLNGVKWPEVSSVSRRWCEIGSIYIIMMYQSNSNNLLGGRHVCWCWHFGPLRWTLEELLC